MKKWISMVSTTVLICAMGAASAYAAEPQQEDCRTMGIVTEINGDEVTLEIGGMKKQKAGRFAEGLTEEKVERPELPEGFEMKEKPELPEGFEMKEKPELPEGFEMKEKPELPEGVEMSRNLMFSEKETVTIDLEDVTIAMKTGEEMTEISVDELEVGMRLIVEEDEDGNVISAKVMQNLRGAVKWAENKTTAE